ncbi:hypothetical protein [Qipengyuania sediminis]|uniref:hypothetical protein n=1 Tax=Qipengyuania sediminis TaxID=1532023 RepID=UPI0010596EFA|nr:hypothetical protein [Qipengyuania sediminis]
MLLSLSEMTGQRAPLPADPAEHPLRASLARGDRGHARAQPALLHLLRAREQALLSEAVIAQIAGLIADMAGQVCRVAGPGAGPPDALEERLLADDSLRNHCLALVIEWLLALRLEEQQGLDPVLAPALQSLVTAADGAGGDLPMRALAAQARFAQSQRRMTLPLADLPAELFHIALLSGRGPGQREAAPAEDQLRASYDEGETRLALFGRLASAGGDADLLSVENAGIALWLTAVAARSGQSRQRIAFAAADPHLGRLLLTLRAAGLAPAEAERQALLLNPDAELPRGLHDIGTREAAQWLAEAGE